MTLLKQTFAVAICALSTTNALANHGERYIEKVEKTFSVGDNSQIHIDNTNGKVDIQAWDKNEVLITATISAKDKAGRDNVDVILLQKGNTIDIDTHFITQSSWGNNGYSKVDYLINVPKNIDLADIELTNGSLSIQGVTGEVNASLKNGKLVATGLASNTYVESHNGSVQLSYTNDLASLSDIDVKSKNGSITVFLPEHIEAKMKAESHNGSIKNDFGIPVKKTLSYRKSLSGELGSAKANVNLISKNGSIRIRSL